MSIVIEQTKQLYRRALLLECIVTIIVASVVMMWSGGHSGFSLLLGELAGLLPHWIFVYWIFFRKYVKNPHKMTAFYLGEGLKWVTTIIIIVAAFTLYRELNLIAFFCGFFLMLVCNNLFTILLKWRSK